MNAVTKKSFNFDDLNSHKINYVVIGQDKIRTHYKYGVDEFLMSIKKQFYRYYLRFLEENIWLLRKI